MQAFPYENLAATTTIPLPAKTPKIVERCFQMNLDRRDDRLREWLDQLPNPWPFPEPERFAAIDGRRLATPPQWRAGKVGPDLALGSLVAIHIIEAMRDDLIRRSEMPLACHACRVAIGRKQSTLRQRIQVRRADVFLDTLCAEVRPAKVIAENQDDVGLCFGVKRRA